MGKPDQPRGPDGKWRPRNSLLVGTLVAAVGVAAIGGPVATSSSSGATGTNARSGSSKQVKAKDRDLARLARRLQSQDLRVEPVASSTDGDCVARSYGQVRIFFRENPCSALNRTLLRVTDRNRAVALVAVAVVDMPADDDAGELKTLVDDYGTGNVTELRGRGPAVDWTGRYYTSDLTDTTVVNAQAEPVGRAAGAQRLADLAARTVVRD